MLPCSVRLAQLVRSDINGARSASGEEKGSLTSQQCDFRLPDACQNTIFDLYALGKDPKVAQPIEARVSPLRVLIYSFNDIDRLQLCEYNWPAHESNTARAFRPPPDACTNTISGPFVLDKRTRSRAINRSASLSAPSTDIYFQ